MIRRASRSSCLIALLAAIVIMAVAPATADERGDLGRLRQVSLRVEITYPLRTMPAENLTAHVVSLLREAKPPLAIREEIADRIRLTITVRPMDATELRGFWLPFSGMYGIGAVRLGVERMVDVPGERRPLPALVWQTERIVGSPWQVTDRQILRLVDEIVAELLEDRSRRIRE